MLKVRDVSPAVRLERSGKKRPFYGTDPHDMIVMTISQIGIPWVKRVPLAAKKRNGEQY
jgi:hypothetical protein